MKLLILQEKLKEGLRIVSRAATKSISLPILNNVFLGTEQSFLNLSATDLEIGIKFWALAKIEKEGKLAVPSQALSSFVNLLPNKKTEIEVKDLILNIECENYKTQLNGFLAEEFPIIPQVSDGEIVSVDGQEFCKGLNQVVSIASSSTTRPEISGVYLIFGKNEIKMVATDSFRLGEKTFFVKNPTELKQQYSLILPQKTAKEVINIFGEEKEELRIHLTPNQILFERLMPEVASSPQIHLVSRLIEGEYPNYKEIIPEESKTQAIFDKEEFLNQIKTASIFSGKINEVKIQVNPEEKRVEIKSKSSDLGEYDSFFPAKIKGEAITVSFNHKFLTEGLQNIKSSQISLELDGEDGPGVLRPVGDESYLYIVMPIKAD
ncbi:MAG: DNA polymerase III subunit beta [Patescibacteria group bacterium]